jgi:hypothetical protein
MRKDVYVANDSGGMSVLSSSVIERVIDDGREDDGAFVQAHEAILGSLAGDDSFIARVVLDEPLLPEEGKEWIAHYRWALKVPCGKLLVAGGFDPTMLGEWIEDPEHDGTRAIAVPPGHYVADVYTYLHSMNGRFLCEDAWNEKLGAWFRRDHPGRAFPSWVAGELSRSPEDDPGHEKEWKNLAESVASGALVVETTPLDWIKFLIHLRPFDASVELTPPSEGAWFGADQGLRKPQPFPLGVAARGARDEEYRGDLSDILDDEDEDDDDEGDGESEAAGGVTTVDILAMVGWNDPEPIAGGPVEISPRHLPRLFRLAWFATGSAHPEVMATGPGVAGVAPMFEGSAGVGVDLSDDSLRVGFQEAGGGWGPLKLVTGCDENAWASFPAGTVLELATYAPGLEQGDGEVGAMRFRGPTKGQGDAARWEIRESYPAVPAATLQEALLLSEAAEGTAGPVFPLRSAAEAKKVLAAFEKEFGALLASNPAQVDGAAIRMTEVEKPLLHFLAQETFRQRYSDVWPVERSNEEDEEGED